MSSSEAFDASFMPSLVDLMAQFATGVTIVSLRDTEDGVDVAMTATSLASVSLTPPLVSISAGIGSYTHEALLRTQRWAVTILAADQVTLASRFGVAGRPTPQVLLAGQRYHRGKHSEGLIIEGGLAGVECRTVQSVEIGDHTVFFGEVLAVDYLDEKKFPLLRFRRQYHKM